MHRLKIVTLTFALSSILSLQAADEDDHLKLRRTKALHELLTNNFNSLLNMLDDPRDATWTDNHQYLHDTMTTMLQRCKHSPFFDSEIRPTLTKLLEQLSTLDTTTISPSSKDWAHVLNASPRETAKDIELLRVFMARMQAVFDSQKSK